MNLIVDLGNTRVKCAIMNSIGQILELVKKPKRYCTAMLVELMQSYTIDAAILSNTSLPEHRTLELLNSLPQFIHLNENTPLPIKNDYETPVTLGKDRVAAAVASYFRFRHENVLFIDMGTCITINFLTSEGVFLGGNIHPGIQMRLKAMHKFTAKLPMTEIQVPEEFFGRSTVKALQNGAVKGAFLEIDSLIQLTRSKFGSIKVLLTGGDAYLFENWTKSEIFVAPNLVLEGLNEILKYNAKKN
jgi:type III pantothenate kinase